MAPLDVLVKMIKTSSPEAVLQFYQTWGRETGEASLCTTNPQFCTFETMQDALTASYSAFACMNTPARYAMGLIRKK